MFWFKKPTKILNKSKPPFYKWFEDGVTNTCYNALDYHVDLDNGEKTALIYDSPITDNKAKFSFNQLKEKVSKFSGALDNQGIKKGDRVVIYMPMIPEAVVAMLAKYFAMESITTNNANAIIEKKVAKILFFIINFKLFFFRSN